MTITRSDPTQTSDTVRKDYWRRSRHDNDELGRGSYGI